MHPPVVLLVSINYGRSYIGEWPYQFGIPIAVVTYLILIVALTRSPISQHDNSIL